MKILEILFLIIPVTAWALWNDRNGDDHKTSNDIIWECVIMFLCSETVAYIEGFHIAFKAMLVSITGFGLTFPYAFNWMYFSKQRLWLFMSRKQRFVFCMDHLSQSAIPDKWTFWYKTHWAIRLSIYLTLFTISAYWFI